MTCKSFVFSALILSLISCSDSSSGISVTVGVQHHATASGGDITPIGEGEPREFTNDLDYDISLTTGYIVIGSVELHACDTAVRRFEKFLERMSPISSAYAHTESSATLLGTPNVESVMREDLSVLTLGTLEPPAGDFCGVEVTLSPADEDAENLPEDVNMVGKTIFLAGTYRAPGSGDDIPFAVSATATTGKEIESDFTLATATPTNQVLIDLTYDKWFEGLDFDNMEPDELISTALTNITDNMSIVFTAQ